VIAQSATARRTNSRCTAPCALLPKAANALSKATGAVLAAQLAVLPIAGVAQAFSPPQYIVAESLQEGAEESDVKTSNLPTISDIGKALFGGGGEAKKEAEASDVKTSGLPTISEVGKAAFGGSGSAADQAGKEVIDTAKEAAS